MALAVGFSAGKPLEERKNQRRRTASCSRIDHSEGGKQRGEKGRFGQARHATPFDIRSPRSFWKNGYDIRTVQELLGHKDVKTAMIYTHVLNRGGKGVKSPVDDL